MICMQFISIDQFSKLHTNMSFYLMCPMNSEEKDDFHKCVLNAAIPRVIKCIEDVSHNITHDFVLLTPSIRWLPHSCTVTLNGASEVL